MNADGVEIVHPGQCYGTGHTNNKARSFALQDTLQYLIKLVWDWPAIRCPIWVLDNSQLMICFLTKVFKWLQYHSIYWAIENMRTEE